MVGGRKRPYPFQTKSMSNSDPAERKPLILGSRGSALALAQVGLTKSALAMAHPDLDVTLKIITTSGDRGAKPDAVAGVKGLFTREIEEALLAGTIDVAVHSMKDLPGQMPDDLKVVAVLERAPVRDVLIWKNPGGLRVATSSIRRKRHLQFLRPELHISEIRGNVPTRIKKLLENPELDGIVLAEAGLRRLGFFKDGMVEMESVRLEAEPLDTLPAIGQGAVALQARSDDARVSALLEAINHQPTFTCVRAERELLRLLNGDCNLPVGTATRLENGHLEMKALLFTEKPEPLSAEASGSANAPEEVARQVFERLQGGM